MVAAAADQPTDSLVVTVSRAAGEKCQRCWRYVPGVAATAATEGLCDRCVVMNSGAKIAEGTPREVLADAEVIRAYLGDDDAAS